MYPILLYHCKQIIHTWYITFVGYNYKLHIILYLRKIWYSFCKNHTLNILSTYFYILIYLTHTFFNRKKIMTIWRQESQKRERYIHYSHLWIRKKVHQIIILTQPIIISTSLLFHLSLRKWLVAEARSWQSHLLWCPCGQEGAGLGHALVCHHCWRELCVACLGSLQWLLFRQQPVNYGRWDLYYKRFSASATLKPGFYTEMKLLTDQALWKNHD